MCVVTVRLSVVNYKPVSHTCKDAGNPLEFFWSSTGVLLELVKYEKKLIKHNMQ